MTPIDLEKLSARLMIGDLDKPFHRPECACKECEEWRKQNRRPTFKFLEQLNSLRSMMQ